MRLPFEKASLAWYLVNVMEKKKSILKGCMTFDHEVCIPDTFSPAELLKLIWLRNGTKCYLERMFFDQKSYRIYISLPHFPDFRIKIQVTLLAHQR